MSDDVKKLVNRITVVEREMLEKRELQQRRAEITLLKLLIEKMPDEARRFLKHLPNPPTA